MTRHAQVSVSGYVIPLIGIQASATEYECDGCHEVFPDRPDKLELSEDGKQFLCEKCRQHKETK